MYKRVGMPDQKYEHIEELAEKMLLGTITDDEKAMLDAWYDERPLTNTIWYLEDENKEALGDRLFNQVRGQVNPKKNVFMLWKVAAVAASVILIGAISFAIYRNTQNNARVENFHVAGIQGQIKKVLLPDQSIVWLKGNSRLEFPSKFSDSTRNVILHGEALFEVAKKPAHPFLILAGSYLTRVVGTSFNIAENSQSRSFKLTVLTGKVLVSGIHSSTAGKQAEKAIMITPGKDFESLGNLNSSAITVTRPEVKAAVVQGTEYVMDFENTNLPEVKKRVEEKFDVIINWSEGNYTNCNISANVTDQSLSNTLKLICTAIGAKYTIDNRNITITGGGCK
jgi:ferric-dicitrate binding protein FerR (iron transport regulator)